MFTHFLHAGLAGLADTTTIAACRCSEALSYASERTLAATLGTDHRPQHPTFKLNIAGGGDLMLTRPRAQASRQIRMDIPG